VIAGDGARRRGAAARLPAPALLAGGPPRAAAAQRQGIFIFLQVCLGAAKACCFPPPPAPAARRRRPPLAPPLRSGHTTLDGDEHRAEVEVKRSRFLAWAWPVASPGAALLRLESRRDPSASHNCWAFRVGQAHRSSDDGEPGGTAGRPILAAIDGEGLNGVCVLVVRHFGGVKLGTGGLARAYAGAARAVLRAAPRRAVVPRAVLRLLAPYECLGAVYQAAESHAAVKLSEDFGGGGAGGVALRLAVRADGAAALAAALRDASAGRIEVEVEAEAAADGEDS
jgi:putative IMPACT (imprinted ancient) family translation regulator